MNTSRQDLARKIRMLLMCATERKKLSKEERSDVMPQLTTSGANGLDSLSHRLRKLCIPHRHKVQQHEPDDH